MSALRFAFIVLLVLAASCTGVQQAAWSMGSGPNGNWATTGPQPPTSFSDATAWGKPVLSAPFCFACIDPDAANDAPAVRYLEVPTAVEYGPTGKRIIPT